MYYIGICDDDQVFIDYMKRLFLEVCGEITFYEYLSGEELVADLPNREILICWYWMSGCREWMEMRLPEDSGKSFRTRYWFFVPESVFLRWNPLKQLLTGTG